MYLKRFLVVTSLILLVLIAFSVSVLFFPNISTQQKKAYVYIENNYQLEDVLEALSSEAKLKSSFSFSLLAKLSKYSEQIKPGRYELKDKMSNFELIRLLYSGRQTPVKLMFNNIRTKEQLAAKLSEQIMADSTSIVTLLNDTSFLKEYDLNPYTSIIIFLPNTYEVFWTSDAKQIFERMHKEYNRFWTAERKARAEAIPLTQAEVSTLASIVEEETNKKNEKDIIAGLYINRLKKNMPLQADPTLKFASGNFALRRITGEHLRADSPYNTYKYPGLPPGPIRISSAETIDAVLNYKKHKYLFMCAKETLNGEHNFSSSFTEHLQNARKYQQALNKMEIYN